MNSDNSTPHLAALFPQSAEESHRCCTAAAVCPVVDSLRQALHTQPLSASRLRPLAFARRGMERVHGARCRPIRPHEEGVAGDLAGATTTVATAPSASSAFRYPFPRRRVPVIPAVLPTYARFDLAFDRGEGAYLYATNGRRYLDFASGISVTVLGHSHPHLVAALTEQVKK